MNYMIIALSVIMFFCGIDCKENSITPSDTIFNIAIDDVSCTEAYIKIYLNNNEKHRNIKLKRNDSTIATMTLIGIDSLVFDSGLLPGGKYTYTIEWNGSIRSAQATMNDTTSHDFTWTVMTLGDGSASELIDVEIINDSLAYAVGEIYLKDSSGQFDIEPYALARWNGKIWSLEKVSTHDYGTAVARPSALKTICAFASDDMFVGTSANLLHWDGSRWTEKAFFMVDAPFTGQVNKMWGSSGKDLYCVGRNGSIFHYYGSDWKKNESGTQFSLYDILGKYSSRTNELEILAVGSNIGSNDGRIILQITNQSSTQIASTGVVENTIAIWFDPNRSYYLSSGGLYHKHRLSDNSWTIMKGITKYSITSICGNGANDVFACTAYGDIVHFNGSSWKSFYDQTKLENGVYGTIKIKNNICIAVGFLGTRAVIAIGKRHH